jgi:alkylation response protein AidB-like acyl-CoA dehydrogenase
VLLQDVVIPAGNIVGSSEGEGLKQANEVFGYTRLMVAAFGLGAGLARWRRRSPSRRREAVGHLLVREGVHAQAPGA